MSPPVNRVGCFNYRLPMCPGGKTFVPAGTWHPEFHLPLLDQFPQQLVVAIRDNCAQSKSPVSPVLMANLFKLVQNEVLQWAPAFIGERCRFKPSCL